MRTTLYLLLLAALVSPAAAQDNATTARYTLVPVEGGALKLDTHTGAVSLCTADGEASACRSLPSGTAGAEAAAAPADLEDRLSRIERRLATLETRGGGEALSDEESIDRAMVLADRVMRRFFGLVREMKREMESEEL
jgi:hypothetical protein